MGEPIYLDYNATTPVAPEVADAVAAAVRELWGNPSSAHPFGRAARAAVDAARGEVAALLGACADEIVFTSGGTESDNAAILGLAGAAAAGRRHAVISAVEHAAIEEPCLLLERRGWSVTRLAVDRNGRVDAAEAEAAIGETTAFVSVMHAQNETGVLQPVREIAAIARRRGVPLHCDAAQSVGKLTLDVEELGVDLLTVAGHKLYAPKGVGALYVRRGTAVEPLLRGAGHEGGRRAGTENVSGIVGLGAACALARRELPGRTAHLAALRDRLAAGLRSGLPEMVVHGAAAERLPNTLSVALPGVPAQRLLAGCAAIAAGGGAACHSGRPHVSHVLRAMGVPDELALATLRLCVGRPTGEAEVDRAAAAIVEAAGAARVA